MYCTVYCTYALSKLHTHVCFATESFRRDYMQHRQRTHALSALLHPPQPQERQDPPTDREQIHSKSKVKRAVANSIRCKRYRDQKQQYEDTLVTNIALLKQELATLKRGLWQEKALRLKHVPMGSLDKIIRQYFAFFEYGIASEIPFPCNEELSINKRRQIQQSNDRVRSQEAFLHHIMDPRVAIGTLSGVQSWITLLRIGCAAFANVRKVLLSLEVIGSEESPVVVARAVTYSIITRDSFQIYFPGVAMDNELIHKYLHMPLAIDNTMTFQFSREDRVESISMESSFIVGLIKSGWSIEDASRALPPVGIPKSLKDQVTFALSQKNSRRALETREGAIPDESAEQLYPSHAVLFGLVREFCALFEVRMEEAAQTFSASVDIRAKEDFLRRVLDTNVVFEGVLGVESVIRLWLHVADAMANVRKRITNISIAGDEDAPILIVQMKNEISTQSFAFVVSEAGFSFKQDAELLFVSRAQFHFTQDARISFCSFDSGCSEALQVCGMGLEEISRVLQWFSSLYKPTDTPSSAAAASSRETPSKRAPKSNRERGQAFRLRQKKHESELEGSIAQLRKTVSQLEARVGHLRQEGSDSLITELGPSDSAHTG